MLGGLTISSAQAPQLSFFRVPVSESAAYIAPQARASDKPSTTPCRKADMKTIAAATYFAASAVLGWATAGYLLLPHDLSTAAGVWRFLLALTLQLPAVELP